MLNFIHEWHKSHADKEGQLTSEGAEYNRDFWLRFMQADTLSDEDWEVARGLAGSWDTCWCGSINDGLDRGEVGNEPVDPALTVLGLEFYKAICDHDLPDAQKISNEIQERGSVVLGRKLPTVDWEKFA